MNDNFKKLCMILLGNTAYAFGVVLFVLPGGLITGGTTGLSLIMEYAFGISVEATVAVFNISMFVLGAMILGKAFALTTIISSFYYPFIFSLLSRMLEGVMLTDDNMLMTVFAGLLIGAGIGLVIRCGASTGGMDIPPLVLNKKTGIPVSVLMYSFDIIILGGQMIFANKEQILYGMLMVLIYTVVLDKFLVAGRSQMQVKVISKEYEKIRIMIQTHLDRGCTLMPIEGGYSRENGFAVLSVMSGRELAKMNMLVMEIDPKAFIVINQVNEVRGRGFTLEKRYRSEE